MPGHRHSQATKEAVLKLGRAGAAYAQIQKRFPVPKSTISVWLNKNGERANPSRQLAHLASARKLSAAALHKQRAARIAKAAADARELAQTLPTNDTAVGKSLLAMLYWGEGGKTDCNMKFTNTDPALVSLFVSLLRKQYALDEGRFRVALLIHDYHNKKRTVDFWSQRLQIPVSQFWKVYLKPRSGRKKEYRKNFYGICNVHYASAAIQRELIALGKEIAAKVETRN